MTQDFNAARHAFSDADDTGMTVDAMQNVHKLAIIKALRLASAVQDGKLCVVPVEPTRSMVHNVNASCDEPDADLKWTWKHWLEYAPDVWSEIDG